MKKELKDAIMGLTRGDTTEGGVSVISRDVDGVERFFFEGRAIPYGVEMKARNGDFYESIDRGAFAEADVSDVKFLFTHGSKSGVPTIMARSSSGTLVLYDRPDGMYFSAEIPDTTVGRDVKVLVQRGDLNQCSFDCEFDLDTGYELKRDGDRVVGKLKRAVRLRDVSVQYDGFYGNATNVSVIMRDADISATIDEINTDGAELEEMVRERECRLYEFQLKK